MFSRQTFRKFSQKYIVRNTFLSLYSPCHEYINTCKNITEKNTRCPHAPSTMSSSHQKEEDWGHFQSTFGPTCRHSSPPFSGHQSQAVAEKGMNAPLSLCTSSLGPEWIRPHQSWRPNNQVAPAGWKKLSPQNKILQAQFAAMCIHEKLTKPTKINKDLLMTNINWRDVKIKNVVHKVDMSSLRAPWQTGPYKN